MAAAAELVLVGAEGHADMPVGHSDLVVNVAGAAEVVHTDAEVQEDEEKARIEQTSTTCYISSASDHILTPGTS